MKQPWRNDYADSPLMGIGYGSRIASVVHLAAYFDFMGEDNPLYQSVSVEGTRHLLRALQGFELAQLVSTS